MSRKEVLILREAEIRSLLDPVKCIDAVEKAFSSYATGQAELPAVINLNVPDHRGEVHVKAGYLHAGPCYAVKMASGFPENASLGLPANDGLVLVFDAHSGALAAVLLDNGYITDLRTGAAGAVAAKHLAQKNVAAVAVVGTGAQARYQVRMLSLVRKFEQVRVWGRNAERAAACVCDISSQGRVPAGCRCVTAPSAREVIEGAEIVVTATSSREPLVRAEWIGKGATIIAVGSDGPDKQELDVEVLACADRIVADSLPQCLRLGEIHHAVEKGAITRDKVTAELGQITSGMKPGRVSEEEIIVCDLTGVGVQDVAAASLVLERARQAGIGEHLAL